LTGVGTSIGSRKLNVSDESAKDIVGFDMIDVGQMRITTSKCGIVGD